MLPSCILWSKNQVQVRSYTDPLPSQGWYSTNTEVTPSVCITSIAPLKHFTIEIAKYTTTSSENYRCNCTNSSLASSYRKVATIKPKVLHTNTYVKLGQCLKFNNKCQLTIYWAKFICNCKIWRCVGIFTGACNQGSNRSKISLLCPNSKCRNSPNRNYNWFATKQSISSSIKIRNSTIYCKTTIECTVSNTPSKQVYKINKEKCYTSTPITPLTVY